MQRILCKEIFVKERQVDRDNLAQSEQPVNDGEYESRPEPARTIDSTAMKAFAHPLRMVMYDYLNDHGSATATMLAKHTGESTGQTSYHLRQLERHGFVTEDTTRGKGRERWWKSVGFTMHGLELAEDASTRPAVSSMLRNQIAQQAATLHEWLERSPHEDHDWAYASSNSRYTMSLTLEETRQMGMEVMACLDKYVDLSRARTESGPDAEKGTRRVRLYLDYFPLPESE